MQRLRYWIALNGSSCALSSLPMRNPTISPKPYQLVGFPTWEEAREAQRVCLEEPLPVVERFMAGLIPDVKSGRVWVQTFKDPGPQTRGETMWFDGPHSEPEH
jgi:hypothetical protein